MYRLRQTLTASGSGGLRCRLDDSNPQVPSFCFVFFTPRPPPPPLLPLLPHPLQTLHGTAKGSQSHQLPPWVSISAFIPESSCKEKKKKKKNIISGQFGLFLSKVQEALLRYGSVWRKGLWRDRRECPDETLSLKVGRQIFYLKAFEDNQMELYLSCC